MVLTPTPLRLGETAENNNQAKPGSLLRAMFPPTQPAKLVRLLMFIQHANKPAEKVEVDVPEDCNVGKVVEITKVRPSLTCAFEVGLSQH
jgi:hypothetical protein